MKRFIRSILTAVWLLVSLVAFGQKEQVEMADGMRAEGKIYVVVAIILIVLGGLVAYLVFLDRKVKKLENMLTGKNPK